MTELVARNPDYRQITEQVFLAAPFVQSLGIELLDLGPGWCQTRMVITERHCQHHGYVHAGAQATLADHTAGAAAGTLVAIDETILSVEFKINLLRLADCEELFCEGKVIKPGKRFSVVESSVWADALGGERLVSKAQLTMAVVASVN
ncbi:MAG: PaaI family thioesterase [Gammaproteobacteria bacterium]|nr:PaaI family thioesterase [Gammaproteobacteria bacterium]